LRKKLGATSIFATNTFARAQIVADPVWRWGLAFVKAGCVLW
jgi:hypothetical protein